MRQQKDVENTFIYLTQSLISGVLAILLYPVITNNLEPQIFGVYVLATVYASIVIGIANLGCLVGYERNFFQFEKSIKESSQLLNTVQFFVGTSFFLVIFLGWLTQDKIAILLFNDSDYSDLWWLTLVGVGFASFAQYYLTYLKNTGLASIYFVMTVMQAAVNFIMTYVLFEFTQLGVMSLAYAFVCSNIGLCLFLLFHQFVRLSLGLKLALLNDVLKISLPLTPKVLFGFLNTQFDKIMLGLLASLGGVAIYAIAQRIALSVFSLMTSLDRVFKPNVYRMLAEEDDRRNIGKYLIPYIYMSVLPALLIVLFSSELMNLLVSESYSGGASILVILSLYYSMMFFGKISGTQLIFAKQTWLTSKLMFFGVMLNVILNVPMIYLWSGLGAALATTISSAIITFAYYIFAQRFAKISWEFHSTVKIYSILLLSSLYVIVLEFNIISFTPIAELVLKLFLLALFVFLGWYLKLVNKNNFSYLKKAIQTRLIS